MSFVDLLLSPTSLNSIFPEALPGSRTLAFHAPTEYIKAPGTSRNAFLLSFLRIML